MNNNIFNLIGFKQSINYCIKKLTIANFLINKSYYYLYSNIKKIIVKTKSKNVFIVIQKKGARKKKGRREIK